LRIAQSPPYARQEQLSPEEVLQRHRELAAQYRHQADRVVAQAREHGQYQKPEPEMQAQRAVTCAGKMSS